jgi:hypothetical protein
MDDEIRELRRWRHDLEGMGIMGVPERVKDLEVARHQEALANVRLESTISALKEGMSELSNTIKGFHGDLAGLRRMFMISIIVITASLVIPPDMVSNAVQLLIKFL